MPISDLTGAQKTSLDAWMRLFRSTCGEIARLGNHCEAVNTEFNTVASAILDSLDGDDVIPNTSGLDGAEPMTKDEVVRSSAICKASSATTRRLTVAI